MFEHVNWLAVLVAGIAFFALGAIWYTALFGKKWAKLVGLDYDSPGGNMPMIFGLTLLFELVACTVLAIFIHETGHTGWMPGAHLGLLIGVGIVTPVIAINNLYQRKSGALTAIDAGHMALGLGVAGAILGAWP